MSDYTVGETKISRDYRKAIHAETDIVFAEAPGRVLRVSTSKSDRGTLDTHASVHHVNERGGMVFEVCGDFSKRVASYRFARVTEKDVRAQHIAALQGIAAIVADVRAFYAAKKTKAA